MTLSEQLKVLHYDTNIIIVGKDGELYRGKVSDTKKYDKSLREIDYVYPAKDITKLVIVVKNHRE